MSPDENLKARGIELPVIAKPVANYVPWVKSGNFVFVSGQLPFVDGKITHNGQVGVTVSIDDASNEARKCAINILACVRAACGGDLSRVKRIVKLTGYVACAAGFADHPKVINGASNLFAEIFGETGQHARAAVGVSSLPLNAAVEIEAIVEVD
jgi:enamine deaminase RidA (YjgF/YER057c/UK114 family)